MASCVDDCLYYKVCSDFRGNICDKDLYRFIEYRMTSDGLCEHFKNRADVVKVVRCKDCEYWNETERQCENDYIVSDNEGGASFSLNFCPDDYCSYGTPKERGGEK